jgi:hypothetical protein
VLDVARLAFSLFAGTPTREFGIDSLGIESLLLENLGFGFAPASLRSAAFCRAW